MLFSCKITSAVLTYLDREGEDIQALLEGTSLPEEFLRDPSYWMKAHEMEEFLRVAQKISQREALLLQKVGHAGPELRSWGVLDSVLRMMPRPQEIFNQPQRFMSYFISPEPPVENFFVSQAGIEFILPVSSEIFPLVTTYLRHAFESLPVYIGQEMAQCTWTDIHLKLTWGSNQKTMFSEDPGRQISPELLSSIVSSLELHQRELEEKNRELQQKNEQLIRAQNKFDGGSGQTQDLRNLFQQPTQNLDFSDVGALETLKTNFAKLSDYMVRAQQLITILVGQDRLKPSVKEAMRRTDWEMIKSQFPVTVQESREILMQPSKKQQENKNV